MKAQCPGQDPRFWKVDDIKQVSCPQCGSAVEFFKDDLSRKCPDCGARFKNPHLNMGCAEWCKHAKECLDSLYLEEKDEDGENVNNEGQLPQGTG